MEHREPKRSLPKNRIPFNPDSEYIKSAMEEYENRGGRITKLGNAKGYYNALGNLDPPS